MTSLLCDVGGTHIRFAINDGNSIRDIKKYLVAEFQNLEDAIAQYLTTYAEKPDALYLATAARFDGMKWSFTNQNSWQLVPSEFHKRFAFKTIRCLNDFEANAYSIIVAEAGDLLAIADGKGAHGDKESRCVIGVGTGLGLAYLYGDKNKPWVQQTYGGHMLPVMRTAEQAELYKFIADKKSDGAIPIYEDVLSGLGLYRTYQFVCAQNHIDAEFRDVSDLMARGKDNDLFRRALEIFFETLGVFTHQAVAFGYSYNGVYFTGGIIDRLMLAGLFNRDVFLRHFHQENISVVKNSVLATPVYWIKDEFISLRGLQYLAMNDA